MKNKSSDASIMGQRDFPFAGLFFLFLILLGLQGWNMKENITRHLNLRENRSRMETMLPQARTIQESLSQLSQDLLTLSKTNAEAQKIVAEFKIQFNPNSK